jgi:predicted 2-oxoglutarate/Fe(II)-dependent dioxygenase YbiX
MSLSVGEPAPWLTFATPTNPTFAFSSVAGRWVLVASAPDAASRARLMPTIEALMPRIDGWNLLVFVILREPDLIARARDRSLGLRFVLDPAGEVARAFQLDGPGWLLLDPSLRVFAGAPLTEPAALAREIEALPAPDDHAGAPMHAPVLVVPRIFEPAICQRLIQLYEADGGAPSGVMREVGGRTVPILDSKKRRRDATIEDPAFQRELRARILRRLVPEIARALQFQATRIERYIVACYDAETGGYFQPHRDNTTKGTAHRRFAVSINLNSDFEGGDLRFGEFGQQTYRPPVGGAVVFGCSLLHEATPVTQGRRYAFLPFLYDEEGASIRETNRQYLDLPAEAGAES